MPGPGEVRVELPPASHPPGHAAIHMPRLRRGRDPLVKRHRSKMRQLLVARHFRGGAIRGPYRGLL